MLDLLKKYRASKRERLENALLREVAKSLGQPLPKGRWFLEATQVTADCPSPGVGRPVFMERRITMEFVSRAH